MVAGGVMGYKAERKKRKVSDRVVIKSPRRSLGSECERLTPWSGVAAFRV